MVIIFERENEDIIVLQRALNSIETDDDDDDSNDSDDGTESGDDSTEEKQTDSSDDSDASDSEEDEDDADDDDDSVERKQERPVNTMVRGSVIVKSMTEDSKDLSKREKEREKEQKEKERKEKEKETMKAREQIGKMAPIDSGGGGGNLGLFGLWEVENAVTLTSSLVRDDSDLSDTDSDGIKSGEISEAIELSRLDQSGTSNTEDEINQNNKEKNKNKNKKKQKGKEGKDKKNKKSKQQKQKIKVKTKRKRKKKKSKNKNKKKSKKKKMKKKKDGIYTEEDLLKEKRGGKHEFKKISKKEDRRLRRKNKRKDGKLQAIRGQIPIGDLNSVCMRKILSFLTIIDLAEWAQCGKACRDCTRLVPKYDLKYLLRGYCSIQQTRS